MHNNNELMWPYLVQYAIFTNIFHKYDLLASFSGIQEEKWTKLGMYEAN